MRLFRRFFDKIPAWILTAVTLCAILWLTLSPHPLGGSHSPWFEGEDKVVHAIMFGALTLAVFIDRTHGGMHAVTPGFAVMTFIICTGIGIAIEFVQRAMAMGRSFDGADMVADGAGSFLVTAIWLCAARFPQKQ